MAIGHLAIAGPVEAIVTGLVFFYLQTSHSSLLAKTEGPRKEGKLWIVWSVALVLLAFATPLGLLAAGTAWGESMTDFWKAPIPDYSVPGMGNVPGYILSALIGLVVVGVLVWLLARWISYKKISGQKPSTKGESVI